MTAYVSAFASHSNHCTTGAAATSFARIRMIMDTARILAVSVFVCLISLVLAVPTPA